MPYFDDDDYDDDDDYYDDEDYYEDEIYEGFETDEVPGCCAARLMCYFPEYGEMNDNELADMQHDLKKQMDYYKDKACLVVFTNDRQEQTNQMLSDLGFRHSRWMEKPRHDNPETRIRLWWLEPKDERV